MLLAAVTGAAALVPVLAVFPVAADLLKNGAIITIPLLLMGMLTAVPVYALLPIAGLLLKKGGRISNVLIFLCSSVSIRIPLLLFEVSALGIRFAACRFVLNLALVFVISFLVERLLSQRDREDIRGRNQINKG